MTFKYNLVKKKADCDICWDEENYTPQECIVYLPSPNYRCHVISLCRLHLGMLAAKFDSIPAAKEPMSDD
jgi:hypothetical protein